MALEYFKVGSLGSNSRSSTITTIPNVASTYLVFLLIQISAKVIKLVFLVQDASKGWAPWLKVSFSQCDIVSSQLATLVSLPINSTSRFRDKNVYSKS